MDGHVSKYFTWREALNLPHWQRLANEDDGLTPEVRANLQVLFSRMDAIREYFNKPVVVHVAYRPPVYNQEVKGAKNSAHLYGMACDFHVAGLSCDEVRQAIIAANLLEVLGLRMEKLEGSSWVHLDIRDPGPSGSRYFAP